MLVSCTVRNNSGSPALLEMIVVDFYLNPTQVIYGSDLALAVLGPRWFVAQK